MSMQELPEDNLDGLFRKSAEEFEPTFEPADWTAMKAKLDENDRSAFWGKWFKRSLIGLGVVLIIGVSWYSWQVMNAGGASTRLRSGLPAGARPSSEKQPATEKSSEARQTSRKPAEQSASGEPTSRLQPATEKLDKHSELTPKAVINPVLDQSTAHTSTEPESKYPIDKVADNSERRLRSRKINGEVADANQTNRRKRVSSKQFSDQQTASRNPVSTQSAKIPAESVVTSKRPEPTKSVDDLQPLNQPSTGSKTVGATENQPSGARASTRTMTNPDAAPATSDAEKTEVASAEPIVEPERFSRIINPVSSRPMKWPVFEALDQSIVYTPERDSKQPAKAKTKVTGLSVRAAIAPDLTTVGLKNFSRPGTLFGLYAEYRLGRRWSIQAGGLWNQKVYGANGNEYAWPASIYGSQRAPDEVAGTCKMVDIPVNIRYDWLLLSRQSGNVSRIFTSAGVTGFVLLKERYTYQYDNPTHIYKWYWEGKTGWNGLSHLNFSVGYEHPLTRRVGLQIEPFMKMPIKGIGFFKMNLITTGAFLSLRYKL